VERRRSDGTFGRAADVVEGLGGGGGWRPSGSSRAHLLSFMLVPAAVERRRSSSWEQVASRRDPAAANVARGRLNEACRALRIPGRNRWKPTPTQLLAKLHGAAPRQGGSACGGIRLRKPARAFRALRDPLPVTGSYSRFVRHRRRHERDTRLVADQVSFRRKNADDPQVQAEVRLTLHSSAMKCLKRDIPPGARWRDRPRAGRLVR